MPRRFAVLFEVEAQALLPGVSLAAQGLLDVTGEVREPVLLACPEDLGVPVVMAAKTTEMA